MDYIESSSIFQKIKKDFVNNLQERYQCKDYDSIVNYVFEYVLKRN